MESRYIRNIGILTEEDQEILNKSRILVIGCGGLGGFVLDGLSRLGIGKLGICEYDIIEASNLNRQIYTSENNIGKYKLDEAVRRIRQVNSQIEIDEYRCKYPNDEIDITRYDLVIDCTDNFATKKKLEEDCIAREVPLIYGAIAGEYGYLAAISPENNILQYQEENDVYKKLGNLYYTVATVASMEINLGIKLLLGRPYLEKGFYCIDLRDFSIYKMSVE